MGMFDYVNFEMDCPNCGELVSNFQSKSSGCMLELIDPMYVSTMYSKCQKCNTWLELTRHFDMIEKNRPRETPYTIEEVIKLGFNLLPISDGNDG